ncbi:MAG: hypothetical protein WBE36_16525 [Terracidiphilus sp.]
MISIRLSEDEYSALVNLCATSGARSISDLARDAMRLLASGANEEHVSKFHADGLQAQIQLLNQRIEELNGRMMASQDWDLRAKQGNEGD